MNPVELSWSKLKAALKAFDARTVDDLHQAIRRAMDLICVGDAESWFELCGYAAPAKMIGAMTRCVVAVGYSIS
jgi:hypothetical protein